MAKNSKYFMYLGKLATFPKDIVKYDQSLQHLVFKIVGVKKDVALFQLPFLVEFERPINGFTHSAQSVTSREYWLYGPYNTYEWLANTYDRPEIYRFLDYSEVQLFEN